MCHIIDIEPEFKNIIENGLYVPMTVGQRKPEGQWTGDERKAANLDQRLKSLILLVLPNELFPSYSSPFQKPQTTIFSPSQPKPELRPNKDFEAKYNKVKAKLALLNSGTSSKSLMVKNKGRVAEAYEWDEEDVSFDENEMTKIKVLMALADDETIAVGKESTKNEEWVKISMKMQRSNLVLKHRNLVQELNTCKDQLLVLKQAKLDFLTMQHVNTEILKDNKKPKELTTITEIWINSSNKVNQCIRKQISSQKKRILGLDQLTEDPSSSGQTDLVFVKSSADDTKVSISGVERPWLSESEGFTLPNHDTGRILSAESQVKITEPSIAITYSSATEYDSVDESSVFSTALPPLEKLAGAEPVSSPKTIKSILKSNSTFKAETLKGVTINEPSSTPLRHLKSQGGSSSRSKTLRPSKPLPLCIHFGFSDHLSDDCINYPICDIYGSYDHDTQDVVSRQELNLKSAKSRRKQRKDSGPIEPITDEATNAEHVSTPFYDLSQSGEDRMQLNELMDLCAKLSDRVLSLENINTSQAAEIAILKERVKKLEKKRRSGTYKPRRLYKVGLSRRIESVGLVSFMLCDLDFEPLSLSLSSLPSCDLFLSCLLKEQLLEPALNLTVHCCGLEFRVLNGYDQKSFDEERGLN
ncbi:hypothetical protein Tco_1369550 [Tanacetum coccineum]